jgi:ferric-chelate reductase
MCAIIGVFAIAHFLSRRAPLPVKRSAVWRKTTAAMRYLSYQGYQVPSLRYWSPSLGVILLGLVGFIFFFGGCIPGRLLDFVTDITSHDPWPEAILLA